MSVLRVYPAHEESVGVLRVGGQRRRNRARLLGRPVVLRALLQRIVRADTRPESTGEAEMPAQRTEPDTIGLEQSDTETSLDAVWNVIVHNDPINLMNYVTHVFQRVFGYSRSRAEQLMMEVHTQGRSQVWSGERELAEHHVHQLHGYQLHATMERAQP